MANAAGGDEAALVAGLLDEGFGDAAADVSANVVTGAGGGGEVREEAHGGRAVGDVVTLMKESASDWLASS